ncbi:VOC family protein [Flavobacterium sp. RHBU_3]|uniref:VOC family protein n=1 Tax=Flavobacterium sp. RHBU_3 TaxID=3391184 RepID=UPI003984BE1D
MKFRIARHTDNLKKIAAFYSGLPEMAVLGSFEGHDGYDGIFIGKPGESWHLEFTQSTEPAQHSPDDDDLLVFYYEEETPYREALRYLDTTTPRIPAKNPYWNVNGVCYKDPDGFGLVVVLIQNL